MRRAEREVEGSVVGGGGGGVQREVGDPSECVGGMERGSEGGCGSWF